MSKIYSTYPYRPFALLYWACTIPVRAYAGTCPRPSIWFMMLQDLLWCILKSRVFITSSVLILNTWIQEYVHILALINDFFCSNNSGLLMIDTSISSQQDFVSPFPSLFIQKNAGLSILILCLLVSWLPRFSICNTALLNIYNRK